MAVITGRAQSRSGPADALMRRGSPHDPIAAATRAPSRGIRILRTTESSDDLTADLLRFGAGFVTLVLAIVLGLGT
jgi:hypothetical protein